MTPTSRHLRDLAWLVVGALLGWAVLLGVAW